MLSYEIKKPAWYIDFSKSWSHYSMYKAGHWGGESGKEWSLEQEATLIRLMIQKCDSELVKEYATKPKEDGGGVYVRTGLHRSDSEYCLHVQAVMGGYNPKDPSASNPDDGWTIHILWDNKKYPDGPFQAHVFKGQPHLYRVKST